jgi:hypothetical protein
MHPVAAGWVVGVFATSRRESPDYDWTDDAEITERLNDGSCERPKSAITDAGEAGNRTAIVPWMDAHVSRNDVKKKRLRRGAREAEGAPLLREYRVKSSIEGSNPSLSARYANKPLI